jgi:hypothetical protein
VPGQRPAFANSAVLIYCDDANDHKLMSDKL